MSLFSMFDEPGTKPEPVIKPKVLKPKTTLFIEIKSNKSIIIGDYNFNICYSFDFTQVSYGRNTIFLESNHLQYPEIKKKFIVYQSLSEIGLWRLYYFSDKTGMIYKGHTDYIQQTMININLQHHLDNYFMNYEKDCKNDFDKHFEEFKMSDFEVLKHIDDFKRQIQISPFLDETKKFGCGQMNDSKTIVRLLRQSREIEANYNYTTPKYINTIKKNLNLDYNTKAILDGYIFSTNLVSKSNPTNEFILFYIRYNLDIITSNPMMESVHVKNYYAPIVLVGNDSISEYGLYENYVLAGVYICKILDYTFQCPEGTLNCSDFYGFIGEIYIGIFPYNEISKVEMSRSMIVKSGGKKNKDEYLNYKKKYINLRNKLQL